MRGMQNQNQRKDKTRQTVGCTAGYGRSTDPVKVGGNGSMKQPYIRCDECRGRIYKETEQYEQDDCYEIDGYRLCGNCVMKYIRKNHYVKLKEDAKC